MRIVKILMSIVLFTATLLYHVNSMFAQQYVTTEPLLKNVLIEEFTGRNCPGCSQAHLQTNNIIKKYPKRVFVSNIYGFDTPTYPNLVTQEGNIIIHALGTEAYPSSQINRSKDYADLGVSEHDVNLFIKQEAPCNIGGLVVVDELSRTATITVEIYYVHDSDNDINYLTVEMLQDSIWGYQNNGMNNPEQYVDGNYCHMHVFRDIITSTWGETISPTTEGTLITKTYTYIIPEIIGDPSGVDVNINHLKFVAFVTNEMIGAESRPILNVARLPFLIGTQEEVFPSIDDISYKDNSMCSNSKSFTIDMMNRGLDELTSIKMLMDIDNGDTFEYEWNGSIESYQIGKITFDMDVPIGTHDIDFRIVEANGKPLDFLKTITTTCEKKNTVFIENENDDVVLELMQDKFGNEVTWEIVTDDNTVVASGGPYENIFGPTTATKLYEIPLSLPKNQCLRFTISDMMKNGICCSYGDGYYRIIDGYGNVAIDGDGEFGAEASHIFTIEVGENTPDTKEDIYKIYPNPAKDIVKLSSAKGYMSKVKIYNSIGMLIDEIVIDSDNVELNVSNYKTGIYLFNIQDCNGNVYTEKISVIK
ncbi:MAG: Omp28-related outer membrane protein [Bacteroidales bacterium]|nr:Omp28-related outer membrane protein [Bacteroidales bacterium]